MSAVFMSAQSGAYLGVPEGSGTLPRLCLSPAGVQPGGSPQAAPRACLSYSQLSLGWNI